MNHVFFIPSEVKAGLRLALGAVDVVGTSLVAIARNVRIWLED